ncbi:hypothetical protein LJC35_07285, partial [Parabacteroides sp. OttesenSCG-928-N08]|nr:hypothetical protein [Parabacteroides sp. OttesenSCG-928-N08]
EEIREYRGDGELAYSIRRVETEITQPLNLTLLSHEPTYIGTLAKALLALEANQSTPFTERLIKEWKRRVQEVAGSAAFLPLHITESDAWETKARSALITECRRLIQELLNQKRDAN